MEKKQKNFFEILIFHFLLYQEEINLGKILFFGMKASFLEIKLFTIKLTLIGKIIKLSSFTYSVKKQKVENLSGKRVLREVKTRREMNVKFVKDSRKLNQNPMLMRS